MKKLEKGNSSNVSLLFSYIDESKRMDIDEFVLNSLARKYQRFSSVHEIRDVFYKPNYLTYEDTLYLRAYSGLNFKNINDALRDRWSYINNGHVANKDKFLKNGSRIKSIIEKHPTSVDNFVAYRGVDLSYFKDYGIESLDDLSSLEGKFMLDKGFVSTSLLESNCFFKKENDLGIDYNVKIEYLIPRDFSDGIYIGDNPSLSYSPEQYEYLINTFNLAKVASVKIGKDNTATLTAVMIPKSIYDDYYMGKAKKGK